ncbi:hypothetical protein ACQ4WX_04425 [Streptomyces lasalocidi]
MHDVERLPKAPPLGGRRHAVADGMLTLQRSEQVEATVPAARR